MANRREEKERLREIREEAEKREASEQRRKLMVGYGVAGVLLAAVILGIVVLALSSGGKSGVTGAARIGGNSGSTNDVKPDERTGPKPPPLKQANLAVAARQAGCDLRENLPNEGNTHLTPGQDPPKYKTNPPTSGNHITPPLQQADGAYAEPAAPINFVHSMEHGRVLIEYSPKLSDSRQLELKGLYDTIYSGVLLFPNPEMPYAVAATSWQNMLGCRSYKGAATLDVVRDFARDHYDNAPEPTAAFERAPGPSPAEIPAG